MEAYFTGIVDYLLTQSWQIAALTVVVGVATIALKNRSANIRYLLWLVVLAKCLVPPLYTVPLGILPPQSPIAQPSVVRLPEMTTPETGSPPLGSETRESTAVDTGPAESPKETLWERFGIPPKVVGIAWLIGAGLYLTMNLLRALRANYWLARTRKVLPAELQAGISGSLAAYGFGSLPRIWLVDDISQPFVWGVLRGGIYLPPDFLSISNSEHRRNVLGHELSHVLRFDAAVNLLQVIAQAIFWFHPFVWWANKKTRQEREKCCDEMAIARLNTLPKEYGTAIVEILAARRKSTRPVPSLAVAGPVKNIEERIRTMLRPGKKFYKRPSLVAVIVTLLLALLTVPSAVVLTARAETRLTTESAGKATGALVESVVEGDIEQLKLLISRGADLNLEFSQGGPLLHRAIEQGNKGVVELLLSKGVDVNAKNIDGKTPLTVAIERDEPEIVGVLLNAGASLSTDGRDGLPPLHKAAAQGKREIAQVLLTKAAGTNVRDNRGRTPLHYAADRGRKNVVEMLIAKDADVNAKDNDGCTPLYLALHRVTADQKTVVALLLAAKGTGVSAAHLAAYLGDLSKVKDSIQAGVNVNSRDEAGFTLLHAAANGGEMEAVQFLIASGADINAKDQGGMTPLHLTARQGSKHVAELLIAKGANVNGTDKAGWTPLHYSASYDSKDVGEVLITNGANIEMPAASGLLLSESGLRPLHSAAWSSSKAVAELLIANGADINAKDSGFGSPLHASVTVGSKEVTELLISKGADVNMTGAKGYAQCTPLYWAAANNNLEIATLLIHKGANVNVPFYGSTLLHELIWPSYKDMVELLAANGADVNAKDKEGRTPLSLAKEKGYTKIAELLRKHGAKE